MMTKVGRLWERAQGVVVDEVGQPVRTLSQTLLREATDTRLFSEVIARKRVTRAELATATGLSKPTVSEVVRRLVAGGLLDATGLQETGRRGRVGTYYELGTTAGWVLAIEVGQAGVKAWTADLAGRVRHRQEQPPGVAGDTEALARALRSLAHRAVETVASTLGPLRAVAVSVANPVHPISHDVIALANTPFPEGELSPVDVLSPVVAAPVLVDNDVNLAALAEYRAGAASGVDSFGYVYVGAGLGLGLYLGDRLIRGAHGLAGEIGYLPGKGPDGPLRTLAAELAAAGLGRSDAPSTDVDTVVQILDRVAVFRREGELTGDSTGARRGPSVNAFEHENAQDEKVLVALSQVVARAIASVQAVIDPELILLGGPVGSHPVLLESVRAAVAEIAVGPGRLIHGALGVLAPLHGALQLALDRARAAAIAG